MPSKSSSPLSARLQRIELYDCRGIRKIDLSFPQQGAAVLYGENGSGKTAVLDSMAVLFDALFSELSDSPRMRAFTDDDISNGRARLKVRAELAISQAGKTQTYGWTLEHRRGLRAPGQDRVVKSIAGKLRQRFGALAAVRLPLVVYYPVNRTVLDVPDTAPRRPPFELRDAYVQSLGEAPTTFRPFFDWFIAKENAESNARRYKDPKHIDPALESMRQAISDLTGFTDLYTDQTRTPARLMLRKGRDSLVVQQLSDGERGLLALVGDLTRRLATVAAALGRPKANPRDLAALVLIDEADLHLHPAWQVDLLSRLQQTFPACQFIVSTHSPTLIAQLPRESVFHLQRTPTGVKVETPRAALGCDIATIQEQMMAAPIRHPQARTDLEHLYELIDANDLTQARKTLRQLRSRYPGVPELERAELRIVRREVLKR